MTEGLRRHFQATALLAAMLVSCAHTPKEGMIVGMARDEHGVPLQYVNVQVRTPDSPGRTIAGATTGADGKYLFRNVPVGSYKVVGMSIGYIPTGQYGVHVSKHDTTFVDLKFRHDILIGR